MIKQCQNSDLKADLPRVLFVDDTVEILKAYEIAFGDSVALSLACGSQEVLEMSDLSEFHLIVLDIEMPGMNGFELCDLIKAGEATSHIPVLFVTSRGDPAHRRKAAMMGVEFLTKPFLAATLQKRIEGMLKIADPVV